MKCEKLFEEIDLLNDKYCNIWEDVCNIESPTDYKEGVDRVGDVFIKMAQEQGFKVEVLEQKVSGNAICISMNDDAPKRAVSISGHTDTVHPVGSFGTPAVRRDEEFIYGPGVMDCKGGVVACFMAMEALKKAGFSSRPVRLLIQSDEENSSVTSNKETISFLCKKAEGSVAFLNTEGIVGDTVVLERKGILRYKFVISGKALHSSRCADASNAIAEAAYKIIELEKMKDADGLTCNCGVIQGGSTPNTVAENCFFIADIRFSNEKQLNEARERCRTVAQQIFVDGCSCVLEEVSFRPAMEFTKQNSDLTNKMNEIFEQNDMPLLKPRKCLSGSDAAYITECAIPCVDNIGVEGFEIHSINERARLASLAESAKRIAAVIYCI